MRPGGSVRAIRVTITHDFMETYGGAERVTAELAKAFPDAPVVALIGREAVARRMGVAERFTSVLRPRPGLLRHYRVLAPAFPAIADRVQLPAADVVLSSSYGFAHRMRTPGAALVCYCHSPLRFAWSMTDDYRERHARGPLSRAGFGILAAGMRRSDRRAATRVDRYLTQSPFTAGQIERFYGQDCDVIGAPVDCSLFNPGDGETNGSYLICGRLVEPYKQVGMALEAFRGLPHRLRIAGDGPALAELKAAASPNVEFLGELEDAALVQEMRACEALVFPSRDDFGLIPVEAMACGRPVVAYADGGALHTVVPGVTGELFAHQTADELRGALERFDPGAYDPARIREHALQWDSPRFRERVVAAVEAVTAGQPAGAGA